MKTSSIVVRDTPKLVNPYLSLCSVCVSVQKYGVKRCGREGEERREGETSQPSCKVLWCGDCVVLTFECVQESGEVLAGGEREEEGQLCTHI